MEADGPGKRADFSVLADPVENLVGRAGPPACRVFVNASSMTLNSQIGRQISPSGNGI